MLPLPNLDDRTFEQLVREARDLIPSIFPEWTDENAHDPGITLLEMLAWHIEMQQFQLDRLTVNHERKFLKLLGEVPRDRVPATTSVSFSNAPHPILLPSGMLLRVGELPFETIREVTVLPDSTKQVSIHTAEGTNELGDDFSSGRTLFYPFDEHGEVGSSMVITMKQPLPHSMPLSLWIELANQEPDHRIPARYTIFTPSGKVEWRYWHEQAGEEGSWELLALERDESYSFHQSGPILFEIPPEAGNVYRLRAQLVEGEYNDPPRIRRLVWNEVFAKQGQTLCVFECFDGAADTAAYQVQEDPTKAVQLELTHALFQKGDISIQFKHASGGWVDIDAAHYETAISEGKASLTFSNDIKLPVGKQCIRVIAVSQEFEDRVLLGRGTGISGQTYPIVLQPMLPDAFRLQVGWHSEDLDTILWYDWERVHDFDESSSESFHYIIDEDEGVIRFSDGVNGIAPPATPFSNIRIISYRIGTGAAGNVKEDTINEMDFFTYPLHVTNLYPAYGGAESETIREAMQRTKLSIIEPKCGITAEDMEKRVLEIPGLRLARVKVIPHYHSLTRNYPADRAFGHISIVVVPYSKRSLPKPSAGMIRTVRRHLEPYRLLTTTLHVIPPEYVRVTVRAIIVVDPRYEGREQDVNHVLNEWLQPYGDDARTGWVFGRPIYKSDVYDIVHRIPGVQYIQDVWLMAEGKDVYHEEGGDIRIPPNGLAISGEHDIEFIISN